MSVKGSEIILEEEELLADIRQKIIENPESRGPSAVEVHNQMLVLRDEILDAKNEDLPALYDQLNHLSHLLTQLQNSRKTDEINPDMPYFAHLRLEEGGEVRDIFLGKATRLSNGLRIVDWRHAPISKIFYRYQEGEEYEEIIAGQSREGEVSARRILFIQRGELLRVSNSEYTWVKQRGNWRQLDPESTRLAGGEGQSLRAGSPLTSVLGSGAQLRASKHLPDIAALIDENQFELITAKTDGALVIRGSAGSGKTTVALHRIAYLAFHDTKRFRPQSIMFMVWGKAMRDYIRNVLPSLGVSGIIVNTWTRWSSQMVRQ
ncbi:MAG: UvrD-helicase domain-containing protein, partial [Myxococcota bacterium]|nr:UvrD-helicase domain-containing protein [Myxococcota bacterium]